MAHSNQEMASRLCWRPYLHNPSLPHYLGKVTTPTLLVWGRQDAIIPLECGELFETGHAQRPAQGNRKLRPLPGPGKTRRLPGGSRGVPGGGVMLSTNGYE